MKRLLSAVLLVSLITLGGCVAVPTRHGLLVAPAVPVVGVGVGYDYGPYHHPYR